MSSGRKRDIDRLIKQLVELGCEVAGGGDRHWRVSRPGHPGFVTVSTSPNHSRAVKNARSDVRRILGVDI